MLDCFCIAHTPHLLGIDVPFGDYDLLPNFCVTGFNSFTTEARFYVLNAMAFSK